jgi:hypothetical protein
MSRSDLTAEEARAIGALAAKLRVQGNLLADLITEARAAERPTERQKQWLAKFERELAKLRK